MKTWYAVYTRPRWEKKVADNFLKRKLESYCPLQRAPRPWIGKKASPEPLFTSYVFVRLAGQEHLAEVKKTEGVINIVYWLGQPAVIRDIEIEMIRRFVGVHRVVQVEKTRVDTTQMVRLTEGPVVQREGGIVAVEAAGAKLLLPSLGWLLIAAGHQHQPMPELFYHQKQGTLIKTS